MMDAGCGSTRNLEIENRVGRLEVVPSQELGSDSRDRIRIHALDSEGCEAIAHASHVRSEFEGPAAVESHYLVDSIGEQESTIIGGNTDLLTFQIGAVEVHGVGHGVATLSAD
jgi:hypothetical protein